MAASQTQGDYINRIGFIDEYFTARMINDDMDNMTKLAAAFRAAIEKADPKTLPLVTLQDFPRGACGDAALLLAQYFKDQGCGQFDYVLGQWEGHSHAWLEREGLIIDITADQFEDQKAAVIVTKDHGWHSLFEGKIEHKACFCIFDPYTGALLQRTYDIILSFMG